MLNFKRLLNLRIVAITIAMALSINSTVYGTDLSDVKQLRVMLSGDAGGRVKEVHNSKVVVTLPKDGEVYKYQRKERSNMHLPPNKNSLPIESFDFDKELFQVDESKPWRNPNLIRLWREASQQILSERLGESIADQLIVYPRGGILYKKWEEGDLDLTFYFGDWVYEAYAEEGFPYASIVDRFISLACASGLSVEPATYSHDLVAKPSEQNDRFNQFSVRIRNKLGNEIAIDIHDQGLSYISPKLTEQRGVSALFTTLVEIIMELRSH